MFGDFENFWVSSGVYGVIQNLKYLEFFEKKIKNGSKTVEKSRFLDIFEFGWFWCFSVGEKCFTLLGMVIEEEKIEKIIEIGPETAEIEQF